MLPAFLRIYLPKLQSIGGKFQLLDRIKNEFVMTFSNVGEIKRYGCKRMDEKVSLSLALMLGLVRDTKVPLRAGERKKSVNVVTCLPFFFFLFHVVH